MWCRTPVEVAEASTYKALVRALRRGTEQLLVIIQVSSQVLSSSASSTRMSCLWA